MKWSKYPYYFNWRYFSTLNGLDKIRNIGIIAHIDAGKTTISERMLFYAGYTRRLGDVDRGDTVLDYLPEERERGITITAASITFPWTSHNINLIDTPGHVDFSMEVARSLRVMDGAVTVVDGRAGVQAQTRTVWKEAERRVLPRLIFVNKLDKLGTDINRIVKDITTKLSGPRPLLIQVPIVKEGQVKGIADLVSQSFIKWQDREGRIVEYSSWPDENVDEFKEARRNFLEQLAEKDEEFMSSYLALDGNITDVSLINTALQRQTCRASIAPVLGGSALCNIGIQPLLDAIIKYLPSPQKMLPTTRQRDRLVALAFKVIYDSQRGIMVFIRVYNGILRKGAILRNISNSKEVIKERPSKLLRAYADDFKEVDEVNAGDVAVLLGLRHTRTGDTLIAESDFRTGYCSPLPGITSPPPVFTCAVEAESVGDEPWLNEALALIQLEDPSLRVSRDLETGQIHLSGMGELHLEIVGKRLIQGLRARADFGKIRISYKEQVKLDQADRVCLEVFEQKALLLTIEISLLDLEKAKVNNGNVIEIKNHEGRIVTEEQRILCHDVISSVLQVGPRGGFPVIGLNVIVTLMSIPVITLENGESLPVRLQKAMSHWLSGHFTSLVEPVMMAEITIPVDQQGTIISDLVAGRRAIIRETENVGEDELLIRAEVPLATMIGYATILRSKTSGLGSFTMEPLTYQAMTRTDEQKLLGQLGLSTLEKDDIAN